MRIARIDPTIYFYKDYEIAYREGKYGIINKNTKEVIVDYKFDEIEWEKEYDLVKVKLHSKYALCKVNNINDLK